MQNNECGRKLRLPNKLEKRQIYSYLNKNFIRLLQTIYPVKPCTASPKNKYIFFICFKIAKSSGESKGEE